MSSIFNIVKVNGKKIPLLFVNKTKLWKDYVYITKTLNDYKNLSAEFSGFNNCIEDERIISAFHNFQSRFRELQYEYCSIKRDKNNPEIMEVKE